MEGFGYFFAAHYLWWLLAIVLGILELFSGTFYLLVIAVGLLCAGLAALLGLGVPAQFLVAAIVSAVGAAWVRRLSRLSPRKTSPDRNPDLNLDIGQIVMVESWGQDGTTHVQYRGARWHALLLPGHPAAPGQHRIHAMQGSQLVLIPVPDQAPPVTPP